MIKSPKLLAFDLDGTLLTHSKLISARNIRAVNSAIEAGVHVTLASGRMHEATARYANMLDIAKSDPIISYNGAKVATVAGDEIYECPVDADLAEWLIDYTDEHGLHLNFYYRDTLYVKEMDEWSKLYQSRTGSVPTPIGDMQSLKGKSPTKLIIINSLEVTNGLLAPMKEHFGDKLYITKTDDEYLEFMNPAANKGYALAAVSERLGIPREDTVAFGDNLNDLPMLKWAGWGIAMQNGKPEALAIANEVAPDSEEDGVAQILERYWPPHPHVTL